MFKNQYTGGIETFEEESSMAERITESGLWQAKPVPFTRVRIEDRFWSKRLRAHQSATLKACIEQCEKTGRFSNFAKAGGLMEGEFEGIYYNDSDVYKVIEGIAYSLMNHPDRELEERTDALIDWIVAAQEDDGYLQTYFTLKEPDRKWTDMNKHECYCAGHLIEAAIAYKQATGKTKLFDAARRLADHIDSLFGPGKRHWVTGHQELELALVKLYAETDDSRYWKLAHFLLEERGRGHGVGGIWDRSDWGPAYCQDDLPVREISRVTGHAVRAMYLYAGMADVAAIAGDREYVEALDRVWEHVVTRRMYITGGIGSSRHNEGFTSDYDLPNKEAYCETCASVGMVLWNHRMNMLQLNGKYADIVEKELYNGALAGVSLKGDTFFYVNPLESDGSHHRVEWFNCSCCPTQIARFIPSIGNYIYLLDRNGIVVNQYIASTAELTLPAGNVTLRQTTNYPWDGRIKIELVKIEGSDPFELLLRLPGWCKSFALDINGKNIADYEFYDGYIRILREWKEGDAVRLDLYMPVERVYAHPNVLANRGKAAIQRGPVVYCVEQADNSGLPVGRGLPKSSVFQAEYRGDVLEGVTVIKEIPADGGTGYIAIPYFAWDNREPGWMKVWLDETK